ncbi:serine/threonine-protein kinase [Euzebya tangerina]|uniref:serine/threonine-protein kinase n=1 Tax=Euzebya tangerina TaxID=591198 RepID=UPI0013C3069E|nr:serine/threonine-protein kinase [Euzebya tangerina]
MSDLAPGARIGPYVIRSVAGRGAVGVVYAADHEQLDRRVAIKTLNSQLVGEETYRARFLREAEGAARFDHPNIINVFDAGEHEGAPYLVMTYVTGPDLEQVLFDRGGKLEPAETVLICAAIAAALDAAGAVGLAHRDVKPANIMLEGWEPERYGGRRRRPHVYLTDFGLLKSSAQATLTKTGQFVGTLLYMSPEQINSAAVPASDQYSLACVMWECLTGDYAFRPTGNSVLSLIKAHLTADPPSISQQSGGMLPAAADAVFRRALAKDPSERFATCTEFVDHATRALGLGASAPRVEPAPPLAAVNTTAELERRHQDDDRARRDGVRRDGSVTPPSLADLPPVPLGDLPQSAPADLPPVPLGADPVSPGQPYPSTTDPVAGAGDAGAARSGPVAPQEHAGQLPPTNVPAPSPGADRQVRRIVLAVLVVLVVVALAALGLWLR